MFSDSVVFSIRKSQYLPRGLTIVALSIEPRFKGLEPDSQAINPNNPFMSFQVCPITQTLQNWFDPNFGFRTAKVKP